MHAMMWGIVTANTSITLVLWNFLLSQVFCKKLTEPPGPDEVVPV